MKRTSQNLQKYKKVCAEIWAERPHICEDCGDPIGVYDMDLGEEVPQVHNFAHGPKGRRSEENCLDKNNIRLKCMRCHSNNDGNQNISKDNPVDNMVTRKSSAPEKAKKIKNPKVELDVWFNHKTGKLEKVKKAKKK